MRDSTICKFKSAAALAAFLLVVPVLAGVMFALVGTLPYALAGTVPIIAELTGWAIAGTILGSLLWAVTGIAISMDPH